MTSISEPLLQDVTIVNELGLHARAAAKLAKAALQAEHGVWLKFQGERIDAKEVIDILTLAAGMGDQVTVEIERNADINVLNSIIALFEDGFGE